MWRRPQRHANVDKPWVPSDCHYHHYWRDEQGAWHESELLSEVGNRPKLFFDAADNAYLVYTANRDPTRWQNDLYYVNGELRIAAASAASGWTDWAVVYRDADR